jgi:hypothetical protein
MNNMSFYNILAILSLLGLFYYYGFKKGIIFSIFLVAIGVIIGLVQSGYFFGEIGEYIFLCLLVLYAIFLYSKCPKELAKSLEGQGVCIKKEWKKLSK